MDTLGTVLGTAQRSEHDLLFLLHNLTLRVVTLFGPAHMKFG
jgi:hypothetical protein